MEKNQPAPTPNDHPVVWFEVIRRYLRTVDSDSFDSGIIADMLERHETGVREYGTPLQPHNGRDAGRDAMDEILDFSVYATQLLIELDDNERALDCGVHDEVDAIVDLGLELAQRVARVCQRLEHTKANDSNTDPVTIDAADSVNPGIPFKEVASNLERALEEINDSKYRKLHRKL